MTTLRSVIAHLAAMVRGAGIVYIIVQVAIWHAFYTAAPWRLAAPALAVSWAGAVTVRMRHRWPSPLLACADTAVYVALAVGAQGCVPPAVRDDAFSWLVISMSGQLIVPAWYAPGGLPVLLAVISAAAYWAGAVLQPVTDARRLTGAVILLVVVGLVHVLGRRELYGRAAAADAALNEADRAAGEQYAILSRTIERREHERLLHDTVLNTLTALARAQGADAATLVSRCRQDVALIAGALGDRDRPPPATAGPGAGDLVGEIRAVAAGMRDRGLTVHVEVADGAGAAVPERVARAFSNATREALSNVAAHAGTGEAWVTVRLPAEPDAAARGRLQVIVRDSGAGFDPARVDRARLGLRRSIAERAADCGGLASVRSAPGQGTVVSLAWPAGAGQAGPAEPDPPGGPAAGRAIARGSSPW